ncbi:hypothetical protein EVAR_38744_1 [Eumeta japonica]|uniref:Uncharacterized protein n=1 Tax=Eumeta variegata TaxID=151549 RepID=A0A4C1YS53_EUMVA|nr:hypothetical protein EVAR_38744_1 [Eumeta japonica]
MRISRPKPKIEFNGRALTAQAGHPPNSSAIHTPKERYGCAQRKQNGASATRYSRNSMGGPVTDDSQLTTRPLRLPRRPPRPQHNQINVDRATTSEK